MKFAYRKEFITEAFASELSARGWEVIASEHPDQLLMSGEAQIVMTPPIEYARNLGVVDYSLVPGVAIISRGFAGLVRLAFNKGLVSVTSIATKDPQSSETLVARIVMQEKHEIEPKIVAMPADASLEDMLASADSALLVGDDALFGTHGHDTMLDLSDEWEDLTGEALPYMLLWGRTYEVPEPVLAELLTVRDQLTLRLPGDAAEHSQPEIAAHVYEHCLRGDIGFTLEQPEYAALDIFFRYAFYHAAIQDIPAIKFLPDGEPGGSKGEGERGKGKGEERRIEGREAGSDKET